MNLVPVDEQRVAEVMIKNEDVGFVREGQSVKVNLAAYPFQKYGMLDGVVKRISADATDPTQPQPRQGERTVMEYLLSPVSKALDEPARER